MSVNRVLVLGTGLKCIRHVAVHIRCNIAAFIAFVHGVLFFLRRQVVLQHAEAKDMLKVEEASLCSLEKLALYSMQMCTQCAPTCKEPTKNGMRET